MCFDITSKYVDIFILTGNYCHISQIYHFDLLILQYHCNIYPCGGDIFTRDIMVFKEIPVDIWNVYPYFFQKHDISSDYRNIFSSTPVKLRLEEEKI